MSGAPPITTSSTTPPIPDTAMGATSVAQSTTANAMTAKAACPWGVSPSGVGINSRTPKTSRGAITLKASPLVVLMPLA